MVGVGKRTLIGVSVVKQLTIRMMANSPSINSMFFIQLKKRFFLRYLFLVYLQIAYVQMLKEASAMLAIRVVA